MKNFIDYVCVCVCVCVCGVRACVCVVTRNGTFPVTIPITTYKQDEV